MSNSSSTTPIMESNYNRMRSSGTEKENENVIQKSRTVDAPSCRGF